MSYVQLSDIHNALFEEYPDQSLKSIAQIYIYRHPNEIAPIWIQMLANANLDLWADAVDEARRSFHAEELMAAKVERGHMPGDAKGQGVVEFALILVLVLVVIFALVAFFQSPSGRAVTAMAAGAIGSTTGNGEEHFDVFNLALQAFDEITHNVAVGSQADRTKSHGAERHGEQYNSVITTLDKCGASETWHNPTTDRWANVCLTEYKKGHWGAQIVNNADEEITGFLNRAGPEEYDAFAEYMRNQGYTLIK